MGTPRKAERDRDQRVEGQGTRSEGVAPLDGGRRKRKAKRRRLLGTAALLLVCRSFVTTNGRREEEAATRKGTERERERDETK